MDKKIIIAIDGYSSSGKSSMARALAHNIGYRYIDSGAMYRAVTLYAMRNSMIDSQHNIDVTALVDALPYIHIDFKIDGDSQYTTLNGEVVEHEIRQLPVSENVSSVAAIPAVRRRLVALQQSFGTERGIVMDGRDIGTTVFPDAELKIFVNAPAETRAQRRLDELLSMGESVTYDEILDNVRQRDQLDETRTESPLKRANDAIDFDNSSMTIDEQNQALLSLYQSINNGSNY